MLKEKHDRRRNDPSLVMLFTFAMPIMPLLNANNATYFATH